MVQHTQRAKRETSIQTRTDSESSVSAYCRWTRTAPATGARSTLYHLLPIGVGTTNVESLTSYIMRLAEAHCVLTRTLVVEQLFPLYGRAYLLRHSLRRFWDDQTR